MDYLLNCLNTALEVAIGGTIFAFGVSLIVIIIYYIWKTCKKEKNEQI